VEVFFTTENISTLSGFARANSDYVPTTGFLTIPTDSPGLIEVEVIGDTFPEPDEPFRVRIADPSSPIGILDREGIGTILNDDPGLRINNVYIFEGDSDTRTLRFTATLDQTITEALTVDFATADRSATAGSDYVATNGTLTFEPGDTQQLIDVPIIGDTIPEFNESFAVKLSNLSNPDVPLIKGTGIGSIFDDDGTFTGGGGGTIPTGIDISDAFVFYERDEEQTNTARFTVTRNEGLNETLTVDYVTTDGSAVAGVDYESVSGTLTFNPGQSVKTIDVTVLGDLEIESTETFAVNLFNPSSSRFIDSRGTGLIYDDPEGFVVSDATLIAGSSVGDVGVAQFAVTLRDQITAPITVNYTTTDDTAIAGEDYVATSGQLTFRPGEDTRQIIEVELLENTFGEPNETFFLDLSDASRGEIADGRGLATLPAPVDLELSLLVDISASIDSDEYQLQFDGYTQAFANPSLFENFISQQEQGQIAVNLVVWSSENQILEAIDWTLIDSVEASQAFADQIQDVQINRPFQGETAPGSAIAFADDLFFNNLFDGTHQVIDISGDGVENDGDDTEFSRDAAFALGIDAINGVVIGDDTVENFYRTEVIGGTNLDDSPAFLLQADNFEVFQTSIQQKIFREVGAPPVIVIDDVTATEGSEALFTVSLDRSHPDQEISVNFATVDGSALAGQDYAAQSGTLTFAPGDTRQTLAIEILGDAESELEETFSVELSNASVNAFILDNQGLGTILDNSLPTASDDTYSLDEDIPLIVESIQGVLANDSDEDGDDLTVSLLSESEVSNGSLILNSDGSFDYTPDADFFGEDSFSYEVNDGNGGTDTATVNLTVNPVNDDPVATDDSANTTEGTAAVIDVLTNDTDVEGDALTVTATTDPANGEAVVNPDGTVTYTPDASFLGEDSFIVIPIYFRTAELKVCSVLAPHSLYGFYLESLYLHR
jgi:hypothetical protein